MSRLVAVLLLLALWAALYLPGLGGTELKGEEGRRILPAVTMLDSGNWLVPYVGGKPFLRKPPLMNWLIAGSFQLTGVRNEWTARLPSALTVLALGLTIVALSGPGWLSPAAALNAALMSITTFGLLAKARFAGAEIEGVYVPLFGIAMVLWLAAWGRRWSPWALWLLPGILLGLAMLAKGPLHLFFYYAIVVAVVAVERRWRALLHPAHFLSLIVVFGLFAAWSVPYLRTEAASKASKVWRDQMTNRVTENRFEWQSYATNLPRGLADLLPWLLLLPAAWPALSPRRAAPSVPTAPLPADRPLFPWRAVFLTSAAFWLLLLLIPGILPRYVLPLGIPLIVSLAACLPARWQPRPLWFAAILAVLSMIYGLVGVPLLNRRDDLRPFAAQVDAALPPGATVTLYDPGYQAWIFYLRHPYTYAPYLETIPADAQYVLSRGGEKEQRKFAEKRPDLVVKKRLELRNGPDFILLEAQR